MDYSFKPTTHGRAAIAACMALKKPPDICRVAFGSGRITEGVNLADQHELLQYVADGTIGSRRHKDDHFYFTIQYANNEHPSVPTFYLSEFIVYIRDPETGEEIDLLYGTLGDYILPVPKYHDTIPPGIFDLPLVLVIADDVTVQASAPAGLVTYDDLRNMMEAGELSAAPSGTGAPTEDTPGVVGGRYFDAAAKQEYICVEVVDGKTVWQPSGGGSAFNTDITIPADGWAQTGTGRYPCSRDIPVDGVTARMIPSLTVLEEGEAAAVACGLAPRVQTVDGAVRVFAAFAPAADIPAMLTLFCAAPGVSGGGTGYSLPAATATRLGGVMIGADSGLTVDSSGNVKLDTATEQDVAELFNGSSG